jgi:hypothetical protein
MTKNVYQRNDPPIISGKWQLLCQSLNTELQDRKGKIVSAYAVSSFQIQIHINISAELENRGRKLRPKVLSNQSINNNNNNNNNNKRCVYLRTELSSQWNLQGVNTKQQ